MSASFRTASLAAEKKHLPHVLCKTNLLLHGIDVSSNVRHDNTLPVPCAIGDPRSASTLSSLTLPSEAWRRTVLNQTTPAEFRNFRGTADLFLVLLMKILKQGGRAGLKAPDGTLFGEGVKHLNQRKPLLAECTSTP